VSSGAWLREHQVGLAAEKLLDAACEAFVEHGVARASMGDIARRAGCARGTLYRYFSSRDALNLAYVEHWASIIGARVRAQVAEIEDPKERLVEGIQSALAEVRQTPATAVWFDPEGSGMAASVSADSRVIDGLVSGFVQSLLGSDEMLEDEALRRRWLVRIIVSLLSMPCESEAEERACVVRFVAPHFSTPN
jgi:AcrR family transcriptional regulator